MNLTEADIAMLHGILKDYQRCMETTSLHFSFPYTVMSLKERNARFEAMSRVLNIGPLITKVLSMELPQGFSLLRTIDEQCYAWKSGIGFHGPVSEFQARLWCWQNEQVDEEIQLNIVDEDEEETLEGFRASLGGVGNVTESSAVLEESMIDTMFSPYRK